MTDEESVFNPRDVPEHVQELFNELRTCVDTLEENYKDGESWSSVFYSIDGVEDVVQRMRAAFDQQAGP